VALALETLGIRHILARLPMAGVDLELPLSVQHERVAAAPAFTAPGSLCRCTNSSSGKLAISYQGRIPPEPSDTTARTA